MKVNLKVLKDANYIIPRACGLCERISHPKLMPNVSEAYCMLLDTIVSDLGSCDHFIPRPEKIEFSIREELEPFLEKREYSRSNRHKKKTSY